MSSVLNLAFPVAEYQSRVARVQEAMAARSFDALLLHSRAQIYYLTGVENCYMTAYYAAIVPASGEPILLASNFEILNAEVGGWNHDRETFEVGSDPLPATARLLEARGFARGRLGIAFDSLTAQRFATLCSLLPNATVIDCSDLVPTIMTRKSAAEIENLRRAGDLSTRGMAAALDAVGAGATDNDIAAAAYEAMVRGGSEFMCIEPIVTVGARSGIPHSTFRRTTVQPGNSLFLEVGGCYYRYTSPLMRTAAVGPVPNEVSEAAAACVDSLNALIGAMKPGAVARDVAKAARAAWTPLCDELIWHGTYAYSVGVGFPPEWNDAPALIEEGSDLVLEPGMCFHTTTSLRRALHFGTAMSETILITETGNEVLTGTPRELHVV